MCGPTGFVDAAAAALLLMQTPPPTPGTGPTAEGESTMRSLLWIALILAGPAGGQEAGQDEPLKPEDIQAVTLPVLRHRILTNFAAEADGISSDDLITQLLDHIKIDAASDTQAQAVLH